LSGTLDFEIDSYNLSTQTQDMIGNIHIESGIKCIALYQLVIVNLGELGIAVARPLALRINLENHIAIAFVERRHDI
jgi:hypothetical protein